MAFFMSSLSPSLPLGTHREPWYARTFLTLDFGLGKFALKANPDEDKADSPPFPLSRDFLGGPK
jgi:hypothetical protein